MIDRRSLRLSATLLLAGQLLYIVVTQFHVGPVAWPDEGVGRTAATSPTITHP